MRVCRWCGGRRIDKDCMRQHHPLRRSGAVVKVTPMPPKAKGKDKGKGKIIGQINGLCHRCGNKVKRRPSAESSWSSKTRV
eukprot:350521-Heterocapsa_arctica.AAC.1